MSEELDSAEYQEWVYLDEDGNVVPPPDRGGEQDWIYVDENGNEVDPSLVDDSEPAPENWICVDENGQEITDPEVIATAQAQEDAGGEEERDWIYVDEQGNQVFVDQESTDAIPEEEAPAPQNEVDPLAPQRKVTLKKADLPGIGKPASKPGVRRTPPRKRKPVGGTPMTTKRAASRPALAARSGVAAPAIASRGSSSSKSPRRTQRPTKPVSQTSLWPVFWMVFLCIVAGACFLGYKGSQDKKIAALKIAAAKAAHDAKQAAAATIGMESLSPEAPTAPGAAPATVPATPSAHATTGRTQSKVGAATIPKHGLIAHYHSLSQASDSLFSGKANKKNTVVSWGNSAGEYANQNALVPEKLDGEGSAILAVVEGNTPVGKTFETRAVSFGPDSSMSSEENPFDGLIAEKGISIVLLVKSESNGPLLTLEISEPEDSRIVIKTLGSKLSVAIEEDGLRHSGIINHANREWRLLFVSWDAATGAIELRNSTLDGEDELVVPKNGPNFEATLDHIRIGPDVRAQFIDVLVYDRPLGKDDWEQLKKAVPERFFDGKRSGAP